MRSSRQIWMIHQRGKEIKVKNIARLHLTVSAGPPPRYGMSIPRPRENNMGNEKNKKTRKLKGIVVSDKMDKTVVLKVESLKKHPIYQKRYKVSKKYKAHDSKNEYKVGDEVVILETRPLSKEKRWEVLSKADTLDSVRNTPLNGNYLTKNKVSNGVEGKRKRQKRSKK